MRSVSGPYGRFGPIGAFSFVDETNYQGRENARQDVQEEGAGSGLLRPLGYVII